MTKDKTVHMIGNAHIDPVWLWRWPEGLGETHATFRSVLDRMNEYPGFTFVASSAALYEWIETCDPAMFAEIQRRVAEGRWELVGGWWIEPDCNLPSGEAFVRQALMGQRFFKARFGRLARVGYNVDSFGHNAMLPQLLKKSRLDYYVFMRPMPHEKPLPSRLFWWEAPDGTRLLAFRLPFEYASWPAGLENHVRRCAAEIQPPLREMPCFYGVGDHGGGPTIENIESLLQMQSRPDLPQVVFGNLAAWFERQTGLDLPVVRGDLQHHASGCYAAHSGIKRWNRRAENLLLAAEKFASIAHCLGALPYPADFERAWKTLLFNQFHDILAGTSLETAYADAQAALGEVISIAQRGLHHALQALAWRIRVDPQPGVQPLVVFNPHAWPSRAVVELEVGVALEGARLLDETGQPVAWQRLAPQATAFGRNRLCFLAHLPALGYRTYRLVCDVAQRAGSSALHPGAEPRAAQPQPAGLAAWSSGLENERFRLVFDPASGAIQGLYDKAHQVEVFSGPAALPVVIQDPSDTWSHQVLRFDQVAGEFGRARCEILESGPLKATLRVTSSYQSSTLVQDFSLHSQGEQIEVAVTVDWHEQHKMLKLRFPLGLRDVRAVSEIPYGCLERPPDGEEQPGQSWLDLSGAAGAAGLPYGLSLLNDGKYSYDVSAQVASLTVLRSPIYAHHDPLIPDPQHAYRFIDQGEQQFTYALLPHAGDWQSAGSAQRAAELNLPPLVLLGAFRPNGHLPPSASVASSSQPNVLISALKAAEDGNGWILRCAEVAGAAVAAELLLPPWNRAIQAAFGPHEIKTFRLPVDPAEPAQETDLLEGLA
jgi:alpha-mannosidase